MALEIMQTLDIIEVMENFLFKRRPPEELRSQADVAYKIEDQSVIVYEIRPKWNNPKEMTELPIAKITYVIKRHEWIFYYKRSDLRWHIYHANPFIKTIKEFAYLVNEDKHHCFWG